MAPSFCSVFRRTAKAPNNAQKGGATVAREIACSISLVGPHHVRMAAPAGGSGQVERPRNLLWRLVFGRACCTLRIDHPDRLPTKTNTLKLIAIAALALAVQRAAAQTYIHYSLNWSEVIEGTTTPVGSPNGILEPGESARFKVSIDFTPIGTLVPYNPPLLAPVAGLYFAPFALGATVSQVGVVWSNFQVNQGFDGDPGGEIPTGALAGCRVIQPFPAPGLNPISTDPLLEVWQINWTPPSYDPHWVTYRIGFVSEGNDLFVRTGTNPNTYDIVSASINLGIPVNVPIAPSPGATGVLLFTGLTAFFRKRPLLRSTPSPSSDPSHPQSP